MQGVTLLFATLRAFSILFGSLGVFCVYFSFLSSATAAHAVIFLGIAIALVRVDARD
jgi:hypothetical protein